MRNIYMHMPGDMPRNQICLGDKKIQQPIFIYFMSKKGITKKFNIASFQYYYEIKST